MTTQTDVLAVLDAEIASLPTMAAMCSVSADATDAVARLTKARAAVAELVEAANYAMAFISIAVPTLARDRDEAINEVLPKLRAALANMGPQS